MKVVLYMATSLNGMIARENFKEDFFTSEDLWKTYVELVTDFGCMLIGRKSYEIVMSWEDKYKEFLNGIDVVVLSKNEDYVVESDHNLINSPNKALDFLSSKGYEKALLSGGSILNKSFAKADLIDEIILNIDSVIVGKGIPLFNPGEFDIKLNLIEQNQPYDNVTQLKYQVKRS